MVWSSGYPKPGAARFTPRGVRLISTVTWVTRRQSDWYAYLLPFESSKGFIHLNGNMVVMGQEPTSVEPWRECAHLFAALAAPLIGPGLRDQGVLPNYLRDTLLRFGNSGIFHTSIIRRFNRSRGV